MTTFTTSCTITDALVRHARVALRFDSTPPDLPASLLAMPFRARVLMCDECARVFARALGHQWRTSREDTCRHMQTRCICACLAFFSVSSKSIPFVQARSSPFSEPAHSSSRGLARTHHVNSHVNSHVNAPPPHPSLGCVAVIALCIDHALITQLRALARPVATDQRHLATVAPPSRHATPHRAVCLHGVFGEHSRPSCGPNFCSVFVSIRRSSGRATGCRQKSRNSCSNRAWWLVRAVLPQSRLDHWRGDARLARFGANTQLK